VLLALGAVLVAMGGYRWGVPAFAWIAPVPFLLVLRTATTWRFRLVVLAVLTVASIVLVGKIITEPVPYVLAIPFALPAAIASWLVLLLTEHLRRRGGELAGVLALPALTALGEALQHSSMPLGTWSSLAVTQVDNVALLQLAALFGVAGIGFVMSLVASVVAMLLATPASRARARIAAAAAAVVGLALSWGAVRSYGRQGPRTVVAAAVTTDLGLGAGGLPDDAALAANTDALLARSELAAARGAVLIAWNEGATFVRPEQEPALISRGQALARARGVELVLAYAVVLSTAPLDLDNKYVWLGADGEVVETYQKHHPVPGEPSRRGRAPLVAHDHPWGRAAGAICYDYDFPSMGAGSRPARGRAGGGAVVGLARHRPLPHPDHPHPRHRGWPVGAAPDPVGDLGRLRRVRPDPGQHAGRRGPRRGHAGDAADHAGVDPVRGRRRRADGGGVRRAAARPCLDRAEPTRVPQAGPRRNGDVRNGGVAWRRGRRPPASRPGCARRPISSGGSSCRGPGPHPRR
jgi:apolipoprotein N-acyltransferase